MDTYRRAVRATWVLSLCTTLSLRGDATLYAVLPGRYEALAVGALQVGYCC